MALEERESGSAQTFHPEESRDHERDEKANGIADKIRIEQGVVDADVVERGGIHAQKIESPNAESIP